MINCYILCKEDDIFNSIVNKVFERKPEFREYGNYFLCGGNVVNEYKSIKENKIKDKNTILLIKRDEEEEVEEEKSSNNQAGNNNIKIQITIIKNYKKKILSMRKRIK